MTSSGTAITSTEELAEIFSCSRKTIRRWLRENKLPAVRVPGNRLLVSADLLVLARGVHIPEGKDK
jgi:excisionase family DNA binding protein